MRRGAEGAAHLWVRGRARSLLWLATVSVLEAAGQLQQVTQNWVAALC
jgi:hypothetical protein